ncbi:MAG TPA: hypothetical protein VFG67_05885, partial [Oleiagrimonas sp.]|nr:hypothetical protein [Oleiagrimonas sp.]
AVLLSFLMHTVLARIGRNALDPIVLGSVCVLLVVSGLLACLRPALRAAHIAPMRALRGE